jgi:hypothetical protein
MIRTPSARSSANSHCVEIIPPPPCEELVGGTEPDDDGGGEVSAAMVELLVVLLSVVAETYGRAVLTDLHLKRIDERTRKGRDRG